MKRFLPLLLILAVLTGCSLAPDEYLYTEAYVESGAQPNSADAITAENYISLKNAILYLIRTGQTEGLIHVTNYDGNVEADLAEAAYEVSKLDPLGAYAVDYMTHSCTQIVSYYEIRINITFRRTAQEIAMIASAPTQAILDERLYQAISGYASRLTLRISSYREQDLDIPAQVAEYCAANPEVVMEMPTVAITVYPETGNVRILEIDFGYSNAPEVLQDMQKAVQESLDGAADYIRYRETDRDKVQLLFTYLMGRFHYTTAETSTPLYDALCGGIATPTGLAQAWQLICNRAGVECYTVSGMQNGQPHTWNIISSDGYYRHVDLSRCMLEFGTLALWDDTDMVDYYWSVEQFPACEPLPEPIEVPETVEETTSTDAETIPSEQQNPAN